jgi:glycosyltransferase involved in cell wall biosynthesis
MRIGLFTDTYRPSINGIVFVVESLKKHLEAEGHEVYIFCPARSIRADRHAAEFNEDEHVIRFPSIKGAFYDDYDTSLFFPPRVLSQVRELELDVIHFFTPGQVGMMGVHAAFKTNTPLVAQHCTDLRQYVEHYRDGLLLPGMLALIGLLPFVVKLNGKDIREIMRMYRPHRGSVQWNIEIVERSVTLIYSKCDAVIALSRKSKAQLESWQTDPNYKYDVTLLPNGVDRLKPPTDAQLDAFRQTWNIDKKDEVFGFVGRLGAEKNLDLLIPALDQVATKRPRARLLFVGDFDHKEVLEAAAATSANPDRITFTGALRREELGTAYAAMDVFVFPSLTDTQGWAVHEAAMAGLPLVLIDQEVSEVITPGVSGVYADNSSESVAEAVIDLLSHPKKRAEFGGESQKLARRFTEKRQVGKLIKIYEQVIAERSYEQTNVA